MAVGFSELDFVKVCRELDHPEVDGWELLVQSHGYTVYRLYDQASGLYHYKTYGVLEGVAPDVCAGVFMDHEYRRQWDTYVKEAYVVEDLGRELLYWQANFPFPMSNRDYVFSRELRPMDYNGKKVWVVLVRSEKSARVPEKSGVIRVDDFTFMHYFDNPKGSIPTWLINWAAQKGIPQYLSVMQRACRGYPAYCQSKSAFNSITKI